MKIGKMAKIVKQFRLQKSAKIRKKGEIKILKTLMEYASLCKKSEKNNDEISRKCQKTGFSGIFLTFSAGNFFFRKPGSVTFWALPFRIIVQKIRKK